MASITELFNWNRRQPVWYSPFTILTKVFPCSSMKELCSALWRKGVPFDYSTNSLYTRQIAATSLSRLYWNFFEFIFSDCAFCLYYPYVNRIDQQKGTWTYSISISGSTTVRLDTWFSNSDSISPIRVETWTNSIQNQPIDWKSERVVIYAQVTQQEKAVSGLNLVAYINGDDNTESVFSVSLSESDPSDVTKGDGIYSALVTNLPRSSIRFSYVVEIVNGSGTVDAGNPSIFRL